ncbi:hypothetical protein ACJX0J_012574, partial [Zea mays]
LFLLSVVWTYVIWESFSLFMPNYLHNMFALLDVIHLFIIFGPVVCNIFNRLYCLHVQSLCKRTAQEGENFPSFSHIIQ